MCRVLGVSRSGFNAWETREPSLRSVRDAGLLELIRDIHNRSRKTYGAPRIHISLARRGVRCGRKRVARLMATEGLQGAHRRRKWRTTIADRTFAPAPDLVDRNFVADAPDRLWVADIKYIPTGAGHLYLAVVLDVFSRRAVGWSLRDHLRTELVTEALEMAVYRRRPSEGLVHHSDQGSQYTSLAVGHRLEESGIAPSMGSVGDAYDNALAESFFATLETELLWTTLLRTKSETRIAIFDFIEGFYNTHRMHSSIDMWSPAEYERRYYEKISSADLKTVH